MIWLIVGIIPLERACGCDGFVIRGEEDAPLAVACPFIEGLADRPWNAT